jgi:para-nitrobenzyl esterase
MLLLLATSYCIELSAKPTEVFANGERLRGELHNNIHIFRGVPFAQPPIGPLRWRAPLAATPRKGTQDATQFSAACMQTSYNTDWYQDVITAFDGDTNLAARPHSVSEDCLYLNVWTTAKQTDKKLPVMVFIYGGNNQGGWSYEPNYLGDKLASKEVVVVSIAYRLHVFGFMAHPELSAEENNPSPNYALLDQIEALRWIKNNIDAFGGDANNVTLFGESAGGANIGYLMLSPLAEGLFHQVIRQSGSFEINYRDTLANEQQYGVALANTLKATSLAQLRDIPADRVLQAAEAYYLQDDSNQERLNFYGIKDNYVLPDHVDTLYQQQKFLPVNVLLGSNADEKLMYSQTDPSADDIDQFITQYYKADSHQDVQSLISHLPNNRHKLAELKDAQQQHCTAQQQASAISDAGHNSAYLYYFNQARAGVGYQRVGVYHGAELPYVFNTHDDWLPTNTSDATTTELIMDYWVNFAKTGNPNSDDLPQWTRYNPQQAQAMELSANARMIDAPNHKLCQLLKPSQATLH